MNQEVKTEVFFYIGWFIASFASLGSLFFSEIMEFPPCVLCWYQRIAMYPLVFVFLVGFITNSKDTAYFALPLTLSGWAIALYHNLLHWGVIPEQASPCVEGVPCSTVYLDWLGFITIPLLALFAFTLLLVLIGYYIKVVVYEK